MSEPCPEGSDANGEAANRQLELVPQDVKADGSCSAGATAVDPSNCPAIGGHIVLRDLEGSQKVFQLGTSAKDLKMGKYALIPVDAVLGVPFGTTLRRDEAGKWSRHDEYEDVEALEDETVNVTETNENFAQDNTAQALSPDEISALKGKCSGEDVVAAIASSSATFASKTKFSQEKYLKKKQRKHVQQVVILRPSVMELCETYMKNSRQKVCGLRFDYLSAILCQADIRPGGKFFVFDCALGLVCGAIAQRLGGIGRIFRTFSGGVSDKGFIELDLGEAKHIAKLLPIDVLQSKDPWAHEWVQHLNNPAAADSQSAMTAEERSRLEARATRIDHRRSLLREFQSELLDAVVIVASDDDNDVAVEAIEIGLERLSPGGRLVVYGQNLQPLAARQGAMRASGDFVDVRLIQLFTREFQVLPQRTHPLMAPEVNHCEGFLLSASKVGAVISTAKGSDNPPVGSEPKRQRTNGP